MEKTHLTKIGDSYYFILPKKFIDVFGMLDWINDFDFQISIYKEGKTISYKRIKKETKKQTKLKEDEK